MGPRRLRSCLMPNRHAACADRGGLGAARIRVGRGQARQVKRDRAVQRWRRGGCRRRADVARRGGAACGAARWRKVPRRGDGIRCILSLSRWARAWNPSRCQGGHPARRLDEGRRRDRGGRRRRDRHGDDGPPSFQALSRRFGEEGRELSYSTYLRVPELLALQQRLSEEHDELLFIVAHQVYELWFKVILFELEAARDGIAADDVFFARHRLHRVYVIEKLLIEQIEVLETMSPQDFLAFRSKLAPASGFQSVQFREIEFLSGLKDPKYVARLEASPEEMSRLRKRLEEPSVDDA